MDTVIMDFIQQHFHSPVTDAVFPLITYLGEAGFVWLLAAAALLVSRRGRRVGLLLVTALAVTFLLNDLVLKNLIARPRPFVQSPGVELLVAPPHGFSCPSGHSASSFAAATVLLLRGRRAWGLSALALAALIAFSRVFLFVHYPTDVLLGAALGSAAALLCTLCFRRLCPRSPFGDGRQRSPKR